jgi:hypothetical protein
MKKAIAAGVLALCAAAARPLTLDSLFAPDAVAELRAAGAVKRTFRGAEGLRLFPRLPSRDRVARRIAELDATVGVEMIVSYRPASGPPGGDRRTIYNALHAVSSLEGIEYFSASRGRMHTFFYDASFVESADGGARLPDPLLDEAPQPGLSERRYASFEDATFGRYVVEVAYEVGESSFVLGLTNAGTIRKMLIPFVQPGALLSTIVVVPLEDQIVVYGVSCVRALNVLGLVERRGEDSFTNRLAALMSWFRATYEVLYR